MANTNFRLKLVYIDWFHFIAITMNVKKYVIAGALLLGLNTALTAQGSSEDVYYRTFSVELKTLNQETEGTLDALFSQRDFFKLQGVCTEGSKILIGVDAQYPGRVKDIKLEIDKMLSDQLGKRKILSVESVPFSEKNNYCP